MGSIRSSNVVKRGDDFSHSTQCIMNSAEKKCLDGERSALPLGSQVLSTYLAALRIQYEAKKQLRPLVKAGKL